MSGPPTATRLAARMAEIDDLQRVALLRHHAAGEHQVGPVQVIIGEFFGVAVDQPQVPWTRQQRCNCDQTKRRGRATRPEQFAGFPKVPKCIHGKARIDQQGFGYALAIEGISIEIELETVNVARNELCRDPHPDLFRTGLRCPLFNRPFRVKHFQTIHRYSVDVAYGLVLSVGIGTD